MRIPLRQRAMPVAALFVTALGFISINGLAEPTDLGIVEAPGGIIFLNDGTGRVSFPDSPGVYFQALEEGANAELAPIVHLGAVVGLRELTLGTDGTLRALTFLPNGAVPPMLAQHIVQLKAIHLSSAGEIAGIEFVTSEDDPACVLVLSPQPDGTVKVTFSNVSCDGVCEMLIVVNPTGGFSIHCGSSENTDPPE